MRVISPGTRILLALLDPVARLACISITLAAVLLPLTGTGHAETGFAKELVVGTKVAPPFVMKKPDGSWTGIGIELWRHIAEDLHLRFRFQEDTLTGLIDDTAAGRLDAAVAALTVTAERERAVDFTQPFYVTGLGIAVPSSGSFAWWQLLRSFLSIGALGALLALLGVTLAIGSIVWLVERRQTEHFQGPMKTGLLSGVWWSTLTLAQANPEKAPQTTFGRIVACTWMATSIVVISVFTAGITSQLTAKQLQGAVHGLNDLRSARVGAVEGTAALAYLTRERIAYRAFATPQDGLRAVKAGALDAFVYDRPLLAWLAAQEFDSSVQILDVTFDRQNYAIALPPESPLRLPLNVAIVEATRTEWWQDLVSKYIGKE
jgi:polar amino acid transport system substrate-binding protein